MDELVDADQPERFTGCAGGVGELEKADALQGAQGTVRVVGRQLAVHYFLPSRTVAEIPGHDMSGAGRR